MCISQLTRQSLQLVLCFANITMIVSAPGIAHAETREECMAKALMIYNEDIMKCANIQRGEEDMCEADYTDEMENALRAHVTRMLICGQKFSLADGKCDNNLFTEQLANLRAYVDCGESASVKYLMTNGFCIFWHFGDEVAISLCLANALSQLAIDNAVCLAFWESNESLSSLRYDICHAKAKKDETDDKALADGIRSSEESAADEKHGKCINSADSNYLACVKKAKADRKALEDACPTDGHGAHDAPPPGHGAPPPPSGHGAPPPPSGHGAP